RGRVVVRRLRTGHLVGSRPTRVRGTGAEVADLAGCGPAVVQRAVVDHVDLGHLALGDEVPAGVRARGEQAGRGRGLVPDAHGLVRGRVVRRLAEVDEVHRQHVAGGAAREVAGVRDDRAAGHLDALDLLVAVATGAPGEGARRPDDGTTEDRDVRVVQRAER